MKFKKVLAMGLAGALCITSLVGCSSNNASSNSSSSSSQESVSKREERKKNNEQNIVWTLLKNRISRKLEIPEKTTCNQEMYMI